MRYAVLLAAMLSSAPSFASDVREVNVSFASYHVGRGSDTNLNEFNLGASLVLDNGFMVGGYRNSYNGLTGLVGYRKELGNEFGLEAGVAAYGNFKWLGDTAIIPVGQLTYDVLDTVRIGWIPAASESYFSILSFQFTVELP